MLAVALVVSVGLWLFGPVRRQCWRGRRRILRRQEVALRKEEAPAVFEPLHQEMAFLSFW
jgi:hypothetical protein